MKTRNLKEWKAWKHPKFKAPDVVYMIPCRKGLAASIDGEASTHIFMVHDKKFPGAVKYVRKNKHWHNVADEEPGDFRYCLVTTEGAGLFHLAVYFTSLKINGKYKPCKCWYMMEQGILVPASQYPRYAFISELASEITE